MTRKELQEVLNEERKAKKKRNFSKMIVTLVILMNVAFTVAILYVFLKVQSEPSSLIVAFFSFTTIELWALSKIKREEVKESIDDEYDNI